MFFFSFSFAMTKVIAAIPETSELKNTMYCKVEVKMHVRTFEPALPVGPVFLLLSRIPWREQSGKHRVDIQSLYCSYCKQ